MVDAMVFHDIGGLARQMYYSLIQKTRELLSLGDVFTFDGKVQCCTTMTFRAREYRSLNKIT